MSGEGERLETQPSQLECVSAGPVTRRPFYGPEDSPRLKFGDPCFVSDPYWGQFAGVRMRFVCTAYNVESGITWVEVNGGLPGKQWTRAFPPTSIRVAVKK